MVEYTWSDKKPNKKSFKQLSPESSLILHIDSTSNFQESEAKLIMTSLEGVVIEYTLPLFI